MVSTFDYAQSNAFSENKTQIAERLEELYRLRIQNLEHYITILLIALFVLIVVAVVLFLMYHKNKESHIMLMQKNQEIERQQRANEEIMHILEQKRLEIEKQTDELDETTTELKWQTENALRLYDEVESQRKEMTDSIIYAKRIQTALLPDITVINEILNDYFVLFKPRDIVSGDFYWVAAKKGKTIVVVADCTGHGVPGAFMSILGISFLNEIVKKHDLSVDNILNHLREQVIRALKQKNVSVKDGMDMALCAIDWENSRVEYAGANIPLFILRKPQDDDSEELIEVPADRMPIGLYESNPKPFTKQIVPIFQGDSLYMFSDGYCDQFGGPELKKFKKKNLKKLFLDIHTLNMTEQKIILEKNLNDWKGDLPQVDDILMLGIKI
ncbi:MAG: serine/threonine-protein phosphatase [Bacteroidales bacterium]|jgi:serine phosphatase RsbU (regulator of sigma subunit)|nr:serine/threonine-protein phosphatase [Bacteroidales bacterium]